jgi:hypothetical protein
MLEDHTYQSNRLNALWRARNINALHATHSA